MRIDIDQFPSPHEVGQLLGHDGTLSPEEVARLESLGYVVAHYKAFTGQKLIQAYFEGLAKGLIEFDQKTFKSMDTIRKQMSKMNKGEGDLMAVDKIEKPDVMKLLAGLGSESAILEPAKRRGRPPKG